MTRNATFRARQSRPLLTQVPATESITTLDYEDALTIIRKIKNKLDLDGEVVFDIILMNVTPTYYARLVGRPAQSVFRQFARGLPHLRRAAQEVLLQEFHEILPHEFVWAVRVYRRWHE